MIKKIKIKEVKKKVKSKKIPKIKVVYKELNNKGRKGTYAYVKEFKKAGRYYKVQPTVGKKDKAYLNVYKTGVFKGKKGVTPEKVKRSRLTLKTLKKAPNIEESLRSGYARTTIQNAERMSPYGNIIAYKRLLMNTDKVGDSKPMVKDSLLLDILSMPENVEKWKFRIGYSIDLIDQNNEVMANITPETVKNLADIKREIIGSILIGKEFSTMYNDLGDKAKANGYKFNSKENKKGRITKVNIVMTYKKS